jgi:hypothetical protein
MGSNLTEVPTTLAEVLIGLIGQEAASISMSAMNVKPVSMDDLDSWERKIEQGVAADSSIPETDRLAIIHARRGQGLFKERVGKIESRCRITGVENPAHLVASHCKPWRDSTNDERLDGENGLLLTSSIDHLFDRGFIGFENSGALIISPVAHRLSLQLAAHQRRTAGRLLPAAAGARGGNPQARRRDAPTGRWWIG